MMLQSRKCEQCSYLAAPRGGVTPVYCPRCGGQFGKVAVAAEQSSAPRPTALVPIAAMLALLTFIFGLFTGIPALVFSVWARGRIGLSRGRLTGLRLANVSIVVAVIAMAFRLWLRFAFRGRGFFWS